jgi:predicted transposase YdaD
MELWLQLINAESEEELEMLRQTNVPEIQKAVMVIHQMSEDEKIQELARLREKALHDEASALGHARREGEQIGIEKGERIGIEKGEKIGIEKGMEKKEQEIAKRLKELGLSDDMIKAALNK